jgi:hypothetical protein
LIEIAGFSSLGAELTGSLVSNVVECLHSVVGDEFLETQSLTDDVLFQRSFITAVTYVMQSYWEFLASLDAGIVRQLAKWVFHVTSACDEDTFHLTMEFWEHVFWRLWLERRSGHTSPFEGLFLEFSNDVLRILIERMPRPLSTVGYSEENGILRKHPFDETEYDEPPFRSASSCFINACLISGSDVIGMIRQRLDELKTIGISIDSTRSLCWAIGCLGRGNVAVDDDYLPGFLQSLFELCGMMEDIGQRLQVAEGIAFVCSSFTEFMGRHFPMLKSVVHQLISFSRETLGEIQEYALESLKTLSLHCAPSFVLPYPGETQTLLEEMLAEIDTIVAPLLPDNVPKMYGIFAALVMGVPAGENRLKASRAIVGDAVARFLQVTGEFDPEDETVCQTLSVACRSQAVIAKEFGQLWADQIAPYLGTVLELFQLMTQLILRQPEEIYLTLKGDLLRPITEIMSLNHDSGIVRDAFMEPIITIVLDDFVEFPPARVPEVLSLFAKLLSFQAVGSDVVGLIDERLIATTFEMLAADPEDFCEMRLAFFAALKLLAMSGQVVMQMDTERFVAALIQGGRNPNNEIRELAIFAIDILLSSMRQDVPTRTYQAFCEQFGIGLIDFALTTCCDVSFKATFQLNVFLILTLIQLPVVQRHLGDVAIILAMICPTKSTADIQELALGLLEASKTDIVGFMRNLVLSLNQVSVTDPDLNPQQREHIFRTLNKQEDRAETDAGLLAQAHALARFSVSAPRWGC